MTKRRWSAAGAALLVIAAFGAGCSKSGQAGAVKIALEGPITGDQASTGVDMLRGAELAVDQANAGGGVLGKPVDLVRADDRADPSAGKLVAGRMIADGIVAVIGPYNSAVGVANLPIYLKAGVVPIHLTSNSATNGDGITVQPKDYQIAPIEAHAIIDLYKAHRVAILYDPSTYTAGIAGQLRDALARAGVTVTRYQEVQAGRHDYIGVVRAVAATHPDLIYASTYFPEGGAIARDLTQLHVGARCFMGLANQDPAFTTTAGLAAARACVSSGVPSAELFSGAKQYVADYRKRFGVDPGTWGTFTYDSARLLFDAVRRAGGWDSAKLRRALLATKGYHGITGSITIDPKTGNRVDTPVVLLDIDASGHYVIDPKWAAFAGFSA